LRTHVCIVPAREENLFQPRSFSSTAKCYQS
jgi:hypothetical protein